MSDNVELRLKVNGEERVVAAPATVRSLLAELHVDDRHVAVERNRELVRKAEFDATELCDGDELEVVTLVGGG